MSACTECGAVFECPVCLGRDTQVGRMEHELRTMRGKVTRLEREREAQAVAKRDGAVWADVLDYWQGTFPDVRITAKSVKSERATVLFLRLESGATVEDVKHAISAAQEWRYIVYGKRQKAGSRSDLAVDLIQICKGDAQFDFLVERGREAVADA